MNAPSAVSWFVGENTAANCLLRFELIRIMIILGSACDGCSTILQPDCLIELDVIEQLTEPVG